MIKTNATGDTLWTKTYGGTGDDGGRAVKQTNDGGYIISGYTSSFDNLYLLKSDGNGILTWSKTYSGTASPKGESVIQTSDGGYFTTGEGNYINLIKTDSNGDTLWTREIHEASGFCTAYSSLQTNDGGYIISGNAHGTGMGVDIYLLKLNAAGDSVWCKTYGGLSTDQGRSVKQTSDGGFIIVGRTFASFGAGGEDVFLVKTDSVGTMLWSKTFGGPLNDRAHSIEETDDLGFIIAGETQSFGAGGLDAYLIKTDSNGTLIWSKTFGGTDADAARTVQQTVDGGYIISGYTGSFNAGDFDIYLIKTDVNGNSGCNEGNPTTIEGIATPVTGSSGFIISSGSVVTTPSTLTAGGFPLTSLCLSNSVNEMNSVSLNVYPNPFTNEFIITGTEQNGVAILYDVLGKEIVRLNAIDGETKFNTDALQSGIYMLTYLNENKAQQLKLVKY